MPVPGIGTVPPGISLANQDGRTVSLADYAGRNVLVRFFLRAFGGGWAGEATGFRHRTPDFEARNTALLGITFSTPEDLRRWAGETGLTTHLLCDSDRAVAMAWSAADSADQERPARISVLIGADGRVAKTCPGPDPATHAEEVLRDPA